MSDLRAQGRPRASARRSGREWLLEQTRVAMRRAPRIELQRRDIAEVAGVTPALINYYFPDRWEMLEAAAAPVIRSFSSRVASLLDSTAPRDQKVKQLIRAYIAFNVENGFLLDYYGDAMRRRTEPDGADAFMHVHARAVAYIREMITGGGAGDISTELISAIILSVCRSVARDYGGENRAPSQVETRSEPMTYCVDAIFDFLVNGLRLKHDGLDAR